MKRTNHYERKTICWGLWIFSNCETYVYVSLSLLYEKQTKLFDFWLARRRKVPVGSNVKYHVNDPWESRCSLTLNTWSVSSFILKITRFSSPRFDTSKYFPSGVNCNSAV
jgi:hypothetical protein